jgi:ribosomal protein L30/L7E
MWAVEDHFVDLSVRPVRLEDVHSFGGDVLATRTRSDAGTKSPQRDALRSLGLKHIGDTCIIEVRPRSSVFGQAYKVRHMLAFRQLPFHVPEGRFNDFWIPEDGGLMYRENFTDELGPGEILVVGDGEYIQAETVGERVTVSWSSERATLRYFEDVEAIFGSPLRDESAAIVRLSQTEAEGEEGTSFPKDVLEYVSAKRPPVAYMRLDYTTGVRASWSAPAARISGSDTQFCEVSVQYPAGTDIDRLSALVARSASPNLLEQRRQALSRLRQLAA